jgi:hypothetical protein
MFDEGSGFGFCHFGCVQVEFSIEAGGKGKEKSSTHELMYAAQVRLPLVAALSSCPTFCHARDMSFEVRGGLIPGFQGQFHVFKNFQYLNSL